ncbi:MAG: alpha/beta fold hydrolase BchO [Tabrizicola flagellatus]|uniref:alpha/beta fold hydrolase BchO n=1 Tax=Tabrizicola flagellatus TaxID=2593021 RepID=UPI00391AC9BD
MTPAALPADWPFKAQSSLITAGRHRFWVADTGPKDAPALLLLHGTGASLHSFRRTIPRLSQAYRVIAPDLPGHGASAEDFSGRLSLDAMAQDLWTLCDTLKIQPKAIIGHSAGAAIGLRMAELRPVPQVIGLNAALGEFDGAAAFLFPIIAKGLATLPFAATAITAFFGRPGTVDRILAGTGSPLDPEGRAQYLRLVRDPDHVTGALGMMADWRLQPLLNRLPQTTTNVTLIANEGDRAVPAQVSIDAAKRIPGAKLHLLPKLGHLAHEETEDGLSALILDTLAQAGSTATPPRT